MSRQLKVDFQNASKPLTDLGVLFSINLVLCLLTSFWAHTSVADQMLIFIATIFGAHLVPDIWVYRSRV